MNLTEKHRPQQLADLMGQDFIVKRLSVFARAPHPHAFLFTGDTGTGKTSAALALARELGCLAQFEELGGVNQIASGEQTADSVRQQLMRLCYRPFYGKGWKVLVVNECDRMSSAAEVVWLDALEHIPPNSVIIFTTNEPGKLSARFRDRAETMEFASDVESLREPAKRLVARVWKEETGRDDPPPIPMHKVVVGGQFSFRRLIQHMAPLIAVAEPVSNEDEPCQLDYSGKPLSSLFG